MRERTKGVLFSVGSALIFGIYPSLSLRLFAAGCNVATFVFLRCCLALPPLLLLLLRQPRGSRCPSRRQGRQLLLLSAAMGVTPILLAGSYQLVGTGMATTLHYTYPAFVLLICVLGYRDKLRLLELGCVLAAMAGVALCYASGSLGSPLGVLMAVGSGATFAIYVSYLGHSGLADIPPFKLAFWMNLLITLVLGAILAASGQLTLGFPLRLWPLMLALSWALTIVGLVAFQLGERYLGPQGVSILSNLEPLTAVLIDAFLLGTTLTGLTWLGVGLVLGAVLLMSVLGGKQAAAATEP